MEKGYEKYGNKSLNMERRGFDETGTSAHLWIGVVHVKPKAE